MTTFPLRVGGARARGGRRRDDGHSDRSRGRFSNVRGFERLFFSPTALPSAAAAAAVGRREVNAVARDVFFFFLSLFVFFFWNAHKPRGPPRGRGGHSIKRRADTAQGQDGLQLRPRGLIFVDFFFFFAGTWTKLRRR